MSSRTVSGVASSFEAGAVDPTALLHPAGGPPSTAVTANGAAGAAAGASGAPGAHSGASVGTAGTAGAAAGGAAGTAVVAEARPPAWQSKEDRTERMQMIQQIVFLLRKRKPDAPPEWINKLPEMARRLEDRLYRVATSKDEYKNMETLKQRLQDVAIKMGAKAKVSQQQGRSGAAAPRTALLKAIREAAQAGQIRQHPKEGPVVVVSINGETQMVPISRLRREQQDEVYEMYKAHRDRQKKNSSGGAGSGNSGRAVDPRDVNPRLAASGGFWFKWFRRYAGGGGAGSGGYDAQSQAKCVKMAQPGGSPRSPRSYSPSAAPLQRGAVRSGPRASARRVHVDRHGRVTVGGRPIEGVGNVHIDRDGVASVLGESGSSPRSPLSVRSRSHRIGRESPRASWSPSVRAPWRSPTSAALVSGSASAVRRRRDFSEERVEQRPLDVSFDLDEQHSAGVPPAALHTHLTAMVRKLRSEQRVQMTELKSAIKRLEFRHSRGVAASELAGEYARLIAIAGDDHVAQQLTDDHPMTVRAQRRAIRRADYNASSGSSGTLAARSSRDGARDDSDADSPADWGQLGAHPMELPVKRPSPTLLNSRQRSTRDRAAAPRAPQPLPRDALRVERAKMARTDGIAARRSNGNGGAVAFAPTVGGAGQRPSQPPALGGHLQTPSAPRRRPPARPGRPAPGAVARGPLSSQRRVLRPTQRATCNDAAVLQPPALSTPTARTAAVRARKAATAASAGLHVPVQATPGVTAATTLRALSVLQETAQSLTHELTADAGLSPTQRRTLTLALETTQRRQSELLTAADLAGVMLGVAKGALRRSSATRHGGDAAAPGQAAPTPITLKRAAASASTPKELTSWLGEASPAREAQRDAYRNIGSDAGSFVVAAPHNVPVVPDARLTARTDRLERELAVLREQSAAMAEQLRATAPAAPSTPQMLSSWLDTVGTTATGTTVEDRGANSTRAAIATPTAAQPAAADMDVPAPAARAPAPAVAVKEDTVVSGGKFGRKHAVSLQDDVSASSGASREAPSAPPAEPLPELEPPSGGLEPLTAPSSPPRSPPRHSKHSIDLIEEGRLPPIATLRSSSDVGAVRWVEAFIVAGWAQYGVASALKVVRPIAFRAAISEGSSTNARASTRPHTRARTITPSDSLADLLYPWI